MIEQETIYQWMNNGNYEEAIKALFNNIEENPNIIENYINAGIILADVGEIEKAERFFQKAITLDDKKTINYHIDKLSAGEIEQKEISNVIFTSIFFIGLPTDPILVCSKLFTAITGDVSVSP